MTENGISRIYRMESLIDNMVLPENCETNVPAFFFAQEMSYVFQVTGVEKY